MSQKMKVNNLNLNDGFLKCYRDKNQKSDFYAPKNPKKYDDMEFIVELAFEEMSKRDKDLAFAESLDRTLNLKVKTRYMSAVTKKCKVAIDDKLYDAIYIDYSRKDGLMYFYLEEIRKIAE